MTITRNQIPAHGGTLCDLVLSEHDGQVLKQNATDYAPITLSQRQFCDLELLMNGAYSPLTGFMQEQEYDAVLDGMHLPSGLLWPMPIIFDVSEADVEKHHLEAGVKLALQDGEGFMLAVLSVQSLWRPDKAREAKIMYGTTSLSHPGVQKLMEKTQNVYLGGEIEGLQLPESYVFGAYRNTPQQQRHRFAEKGWRKIIAFQTSKVIHRLQRDILLDVAKQARGHLLIHPTIGSTKPGDTHYYTRVHCYEAVLKYLPKQLAMLSLMHLSMRMAGARESLWYGIIHQNFGCTHFIVGPNHAMPPLAADADFNYESQKLIKAHQHELEIEMIALQEYQYLPEQDRILPMSEIKRTGYKGVRFSEKKIQEAMHQNKPVESWCSFPEVIAEMRKAYPPRGKQGFTLFFTGLSGSGKSTLARIISAQLIEQGPRPVTLLDGDIVRLNLSSELGFSKAHRDLNIRRVGFVANEITKNGGVAICAPIAPYTKSRRDIREQIEQHGAFIEIHVSTPLTVCESRDRKGLYAKARKGLIPEFTGISDPYEVPVRAEFVIDTSNIGPLEASQELMLYLLQRGFLDT